MSISPAPADPRAQNVQFTDEELTVVLDDGRKIVVPLEWFPRLLFATHEQRFNWELLGDGAGIHWPDVGEYISVAGLLRGARSTEQRK